MYHQITYSSPQEYAQLDYFQAKTAEYKPSAAYWANRRRSTLVSVMKEQDDIDTEEVQTMLTSLLTEHIERIRRMSDEEVISVRSEMVELFSKIHLSFDNLSDPRVYVSLFNRFASEKGIQVSQMVDDLQRHFRGKFKIYFHDAYDFLNILWTKYQRFILHTQPQPFIQLT